MTSRESDRPGLTRARAMLAIEIDRRDHGLIDKPMSLQTDEIRALMVIIDRFGNLDSSCGALGVAKEIGMKI